MNWVEKLVQSEDSGVFWLDMGAEGAELTQLLGCCLVNPSIFCPCDTQQNRHGFRWLDVVILGMNEGKIVCYNATYFYHSDSTYEYIKIFLHIKWLFNSLDAHADRIAK